MNQIIFLGVPVQVVAELGQVAGADHAVGAHHEGRIDLFVAVLAHVHVDKPVGQRALQAGAGALQQVEAAAGELDAPLEVDDAQRLAQFPVRLGREVKDRLGARTP